MSCRLSAAHRDEEVTARSASLSMRCVYPRLMLRVVPATRVVPAARVAPAARVVQRAALSTVRRQAGRQRAAVGALAAAQVRAPSTMRPLAPAKLAAAAGAVVGGDGGRCRRSRQPRSVPFASSQDAIGGSPRRPRSTATTTAHRKSTTTWGELPHHRTVNHAFDIDVGLDGWFCRTTRATHSTPPTGDLADRDPTGPEPEPELDRTLTATT